MGAKRNTPPPPLSHQAERAARFEAHRVGGLVEAWEQQVGLPPRRKLHPSKSVGSLQRPQSAGPGRARRPRSAGVRTRGGGGQVIIERSESSLPPNGARAAESRVQERLAKIRSSGAELAELERRVSSYRKGRPTGDGVYHVTQNMDPVILRRKRPQTVHAVSREHNDKYRALAREQRLAKLAASKGKGQKDPKGKGPTAAAAPAAASARRLLGVRGAGGGGAAGASGGSGGGRGSREGGDAVHGGDLRAGSPAPAPGPFPRDVPFAEEVGL